jgi:cysteine desulfurase
MYANNEIGTVQPIREIAKEIRHHRKTTQNNFPIFHTDACQAMNYLDVENIEKLGVDLLTFNSSKIYGPKGIAVLYKKRGIGIHPIYEGGGQESGLRSGTENTAAIVGVAKAFEITCTMKEKESVRLTKLRDYGIEKLLALSGASGYEVVLNGDKENRLPNNINISISRISSELLVIELDAKGILVSAKSACKSDEPDESYVITALRKAQNIQSNNVDGSLRISLGRSTTKGDIDTLVKSLKLILEKYSKWK